MTRTETGSSSSNSRLSQSSSTFQERPPTKRVLEGAENSPSAVTLTFLVGAEASASALRFLLGSSVLVAGFSSSDSDSSESSSSSSESEEPSEDSSSESAYTKN